MSISITFKFKFALLSDRIAWCKEHLEEAINNEDLDKIQEYRDLLVETAKLYDKEVEKLINAKLP